LLSIFLYLELYNLYFYSPWTALNSEDYYAQLLRTILLTILVK